MHYLVFAYSNLYLYAVKHISFKMPANAKPSDLGPFTRNASLLSCRNPKRSSPPRYGLQHCQ